MREEAVLISFAVCGTGGAAPEYILTNETLSQMVDTSDEWIMTRTGIRERHICTQETLLDLAASAAEEALAQAGIKGTDLDLILCATMQGDYVTPSLSCQVQQAIGAVCPAMDINGACSGFLYAMDVAAGYYARGTVKHVLVLAAECMSKHVDWEDRSTCVLFGDGAGAVVLGPGEGLAASRLYSCGSAEHLNIRGTTGTFPPAHKKPAKQVVHMNGQEIYRFAVQSMCREIKAALETARMEISQMRYVLVHQANLRILEAAQKRLNITADKMPVCLDRYGNTSSASIPLMLSELSREGKLRRGDWLVLCAFGGGLTVGTAVLRW